MHVQNLSDTAIEDKILMFRDYVDTPIAVSLTAFHVEPKFIEPIYVCTNLERLAEVPEQLKQKYWVENKVIQIELINQTRYNYIEYGFSYIPIQYVVNFDTQLRISKLLPFTSLYVSIQYSKRVGNMWQDYPKNFAQ